jgi:hypothetical protein
LSFLENLISQPFTTIIISLLLFHSNPPQMAITDKQAREHCQSTRLDHLKSVPNCPFDIDKKCPAFVRALFYHHVEKSQEMMVAINFAERDQGLWAPWFSENIENLDGCDPSHRHFIKSIVTGAERKYSGGKNI